LNHQIFRWTCGALEGLPKDEYDTKWIGWPGAAFSIESQRQEIARRLAEEYGCVAVFLGQDEATAFYEGFSNSSIWPLLHYLPNYLRYEPAWWEHYQNVNRTFAEKVLGTARDGDLVWVHDYQLMLLPAILRAESPCLRIGFFLHAPFPAYEIFRSHPRRQSLMRRLEAFSGPQEQETKGKQETKGQENRKRRDRSNIERIP
jgi:trehalose 6-phosphate synthase/phosphatase